VLCVVGCRVIEVDSRDIPSSSQFNFLLLPYSFPLNLQTHSPLLNSSNISPFSLSLSPSLPLSLSLSLSLFLSPHFFSPFSPFFTPFLLFPLPLPSSLLSSSLSLSPFLLLSPFSFPCRNQGIILGAKTGGRIIASPAAQGRLLRSVSVTATAVVTVVVLGVLSVTVSVVTESQ
jgi:hypothetical protein